MYAYLRADHRIVDHYEFGHCLGVGGFSKVISVKNKNTGRQGAVKMIKICRNDKYDRILVKMIINEVEILTRLDHKNILNF